MHFTQSQQYTDFLATEIMTLREHRKSTADTLENPVGIKTVGIQRLLDSIATDSMEIARLMELIHMVNRNG